MEVCRKFDALYAPIFKVFLVNFLQDVLSSALLRRLDRLFISRYTNALVSEETETKTKTLLLPTCSPSPTKGKNFWISNVFLTAVVWGKGASVIRHCCIKQCGAAEVNLRLSLTIFSYVGVSFALWPINQRGRGDGGCPRYPVDMRRGVSLLCLLSRRRRTDVLEFGVRHWVLRILLS